MAFSVFIALSDINFSPQVFLAYLNTFDLKENASMLSDVKNVFSGLKCQASCKIVRNWSAKRSDYFVGTTTLPYTLCVDKSAILRVFRSKLTHCFGASVKQGNISSQTKGMFA